VEFVALIGGHVQRDVSGRPKLVAPPQGILLGYNQSNWPSGGKTEEDDEEDAILSQRELRLYILPVS
jgi:hypothetical protein